ncbi:hypothetical protein Bca4012_026126 [Brassica carinata]|uniref:Uncharacterized protein n=1 Tax=Brassica carinata TaxID=52824 RepID=A0A8X7VIM2_BRACI|nr:hypothetical protein Bca52824_023227 [Brassica carinata]
MNIQVSASLQVIERVSGSEELWSLYMKRARDRWRQNIIVQVSSHEVPERSWQRGVELQVLERVMAARSRGSCTSCEYQSGLAQRVDVPAL